MTITKDSIEQSYAFLHQKWRIYSQSNMPTQRDDIEYAVASYTEVMNRDLYTLLAEGRTDYLMAHATFAADIERALERLELFLMHHS